MVNISESPSYPYALSVEIIHTGSKLLLVAMTSWRAILWKKDFQVTCIHAVVDSVGPSKWEKDAVTFRELPTTVCPSF